MSKDCLVNLRRMRNRLDKKVMNCSRTGLNPLKARLNENLDNLGNPFGQDYFFLFDQKIRTGVAVLTIISKKTWLRKSKCFDTLRIFVGTAINRGRLHLGISVFIETPGVTERGTRVDHDEGAEEQKNNTVFKDVYVHGWESYHRAESECNPGTTSSPQFGQ